MYVYKSVAGCDIGLDLYLSSQPSAPLLVMIHGGGFVFGSRRDISKTKIEFFLSHGIHVAVIDYRLLPESTFSDMLSDVEDAITWIQAHMKKTGLQVTRLFVMGYSAGGFLAYHTGTMSQKPHGIINLYGYADLTESWCKQISAYYLSKTRVDNAAVSSLIGKNPVSSPPPYRYLYYLYLRQNGLWMQTITRSAQLNDYTLKTLSPMEKITASFPRTLIIHGKRDHDVPFQAALNVTAKLESLNVPVKKIFLEHEGHDFDLTFENTTTLDVYENIVLFIKDPIDDRS